MRRSAVIALVLVTAGLAGQDAPPADGALRAAYDAWQVQQKAFTEAALAARRTGAVPKGGELPAEARDLQTKADRARDALLAEFGALRSLSAKSDVLLARAHEAGRDYARAVVAYERALAKPDGAENLQTLRALCVAAMNSKDDALAARWMEVLLRQEDEQKVAQRNLTVRTSYYPRTLIALGRWDDLAALLARLDADPAPACRSAAATFGVVHALHGGDLAGASRRVAAIEADPVRFADQQAWAALARLALEVGAGRFDAGAAAVRAYLAKVAAEPGQPAPVEANQRRYLVAIEPFLGKPAPELRVDHVVGGAADLTGGPVACLRGKVVVLDFWQSWCEPCRKAMPELVAAQKAHAGDLAVLGVCRVENYGYDVSERRAVRPIAAADFPAHVADFRADMGLNYPLLIAADGSNSETYRVAGIPTLVIVDRQGIVRYMSCGAGEPGLFGAALAGVLQAK